MKNNTIEFVQNRVRLGFKVRGDLFSSHEIDAGTKLLIRTLAIEGTPVQKMLDVGCGYGPIGLTMKALDTNRRVHLVDRDFLAVAYSRKNAEFNGLNVEVYGSLGYDDLKETSFDLIASNIPAKAGPRVIEELILGARDHLAPNGRVAIVVIIGLAPKVEEILEASEDVNILLKRETKNYVSFHYTFDHPREASSAGTSFERGIFDRESFFYQSGDRSIEARTVYGIGEFDTLGYPTQLAADQIRLIPSGSIARLAVLNPGQGHLAAIAWITLGPRSILLVDRDLLALRTSKRSLLLNGAPASAVRSWHSIDFRDYSGEKFDVLIDPLRDKEPSDAYLRRISDAVEILRPGGFLMLAGRSTAITRCQTELGKLQNVKVQKRTKLRGFSCLVTRVLAGKGVQT